MNHIKFFLTAVVFLILCSAVWADIPKQINFQGILKDSLGNPYPDGNYSITFRIYDAVSSGNILWQEGQLIAISGGLFTHILGSAIAIPDSVFNNSLRWLGIQVAGNPEITPRTQLNSAPYSFQALRSDSAAVATLSLDLTCNGCVDANDLAANSVGTSEIVATQVQRRVTGTAPGGEFITAINQDGSVVTAVDQVSAPSGWTDDGAAVRLTTATDLVGIGTSAPLGLLHLKGNNYKFLLESSGNADVVIGRADTTRYGNYILANGDPSLSVNNRWAIGLRNGDSKLHLYSEVNSSNVMVLEPGGNVGVGTATPADKLHVSKGAGEGLPGNLVNEGLVVNNNAAATDNAGINIIGGSSGYSRINFGDNGSAFDGFIRYNHSTSALEFGNGGFQVMTLDGALLGIGEVNPSTRLYVSEFQSTVATFNRNGNDGTLVNLSVSGVTQGTISVSAGTVSYNAFTGSHYGWTEEALERGELVTLTGMNSNSHDNPQAEVIYGIKRSTVPNDPACLGSYLGLQSSSETYSTENPHLIMAVGNGEMWVVDEGQNIQPGDYLISSGVPGHAMKDDEQRFPIGHIMARAAETVDWSIVSETVNGRRHKKISVLFGNFVRGNVTNITRTIEEQQEEIEELKNRMLKLEAGLLRSQAEN